MSVFRRRRREDDDAAERNGEEEDQASEATTQPADAEEQHDLSARPEGPWDAAERPDAEG